MSEIHKPEPSTKFLKSLNLASSNSIQPDLSIVKREVEDQPDEGFEQGRSVVAGSSDSINTQTIKIKQEPTYWDQNQEDTCPQDLGLYSHYVRSDSHIVDIKIEENTSDISEGVGVSADDETPKYLYFEVKEETGVSGGSSGLGSEALRPRDCDGEAENVLKKDIKDEFIGAPGKTSKKSDNSQTSIKDLSSKETTKNVTNIHIAVDVHKHVKHEQGSEIKTNKHDINKDKRPFACDECGKKYTAKSSLNTHLQIHSGVKPYTCEECGKKFTYKKIFAQHLRTHSEDSRYCCNECGKKYKHKQYLVIHLRTHTGDNIFTCKKCGKTYKSQSYFKLHERTHTSEMSCICNQCGKKFMCKSILSQHLQTHTVDKKFACDDCGMKFKNKHNLGMHMRIHLGVKPHTCHICERTFSQKYNLTEHIRTHSNEKPFECNYCKKKFKSSNYYKKHVLSHVGDKPYKCNQCGMKFEHNESLEEHRGIGESPFACNKCEKTFTCISLFNRHLRAHNGKKLFPCHLCRKSYIQNSFLTKHLLTHAGEIAVQGNEREKSFEQTTHLVEHLHPRDENFLTCTQCGKSFIHINFLTRHMLTHLS